MGVFVAEYWQLYAMIPEFDSLMHVLGGIAVAWMTLALLQNDIQRLSALKQLLIIVSVTALVGVFWECAEYISGFTKNSYPLLYHYFHGGGLADTLLDLVADLVGGTFLALWALWKEQTR